jgi:amidophosphoribosyltransferase
MDTSDQSRLLAARMTVDEIAAYLEVDSIGYLSIEGLVTGTGAPRDGFCTACLTGEYPTDISDAEGKFVLEPAGQ